MIKKYRIKSWVMSVLLAVGSVVAYAQTPNTDLTTHQPTAAAPAGTTFEWHTGSLSSSALVGTPSAVAPGLYYGFYNYGSSCFSAGAPVRVITNTCPTATVNLNDAVNAAPAGYTLSFHSGSTASDGNAITGTAITAAPAGTYFVAYKSTVGGVSCYSATSPIVVVVTPCSPDTDGDGLADDTDLDDDNDGILDTTEDAQLTADVDGDGIPNRLDLDSDNDGINDVIEAGGTDTDKNGQADGVVSATGIPASAGTGDTLVGDDADGDTRPNPYDLDSDNDGINDLVESGNPLLVDADGNGMVDGTDPDKDGILGAADATPTVFGDSNDPAPVNTDGTTTPNYLDLDSDNDGLTDLAESGIPNVPTLDANGDGKIDNPADADGDGIPQVVDGAPTVFGDANNPTLPDGDNDGNPDYTDPTDTDGDGVADATDLDDDNDGILDTVEDAQLTADVDGDGIPNRLDLDSDNDGINDVIEAGGTDADKNGQADGVVSATGIPATAGTGDTLVGDDADGDTRPNPYDLDSDNDGINDLVESGNPLLVDADGNGMVDGTDPDKDGILGAADATPTVYGDSNDPAPVNTDGTTTPNYLDLDSDNDGLTDLAESGIPNVPTLDANGDGKIDNPADADGDGIPQVVDGAPTVFGDANNPTLPDGNTNGNPDYTDPTDTDGDGVADATDLDDDNDGILDTVEDAQLTADVDGDGIPNRLDLDSDNDGINDVIEAGGTDADKNGQADGVVSATGIPATAGTGDTLVGDDADGDTRPNPYDLDSDNDGINDLVESGNPLLLDADGNGMVDGTDPDKDGILGAADATPTVFGDSNDPAPVNTDGTTTPNYLDLDSDNDGLTDLAESGIPNVPTLDANGDGKIDNPADADGDGIPQVVDGAPTVFGDANNPTLPDGDNDGNPDYTDPTDTDGDGVADATDLDDDNDGILDTVEDAQLTADVDGDGIPNRLDLDSDNDGINDVIEAGGTDADKNGQADGVVSATGIPATAGTGDTLVGDDADGDTRPNPYDLDSDNDGINDLVESGNPLLIDADGNGMVDGTDPDKDGILGAADATPTVYGDSNDPAPANTDGTTTPNYLDLDSDNDGLTDLVESGLTNIPTLDANGDGKIDNPADADGDGIPQVVDGAPTVFGDANNPTLPDSNTNGNPDYTDPTDTDGDGVGDATDLDDDNDGILDTVEDAQLTADVDGDGIPNRLDLDSDNDGINDVIEAGGTDTDKNGQADGVVSATGIPASAGTGDTLVGDDADGDTRPNPYDLDSDNDGINDLVESGNPLLVDANGDGLVDGTDPDKDGILGAADATPTVYGDSNDPAPVNTDGTTTPNYLDLDSDNDGLTDLAESGIPNVPTLDANGDGKIDNPADADGDGIPQVVDGAPTVFGDANNPPLQDTDNNGTPDYVQGNVPSLSISITNGTKAEGNSGNTAFIFTIIRGSNPTGTTTVNWAVAGSGTNAANATDFGGSLPSGTITFLNGESSKDITVNVSGDAVIENDETFTVTLTNPSAPAVISVASAVATIQNDDVTDTDGDGITDTVDLDDDNDGILDTVEDAQLTADIDSDGVPNRLDLDSDNDGINDVIEAGGTDTGKDGIADGIPNAQGIPATAGTGLTPPDTDSDTRPNPYDLDSDNDGINDLVESGNPVLADTNGDGKVDGTDPDADGILGTADATPGVRGDNNDPTPANTDGTGNPNYTDLDSDDDGLTDLAESGITNVPTLDANGDGKIDNPADADGDGIPQVVDGAPTVFGDANNPTLPDANNNNPDYTDPIDTDNDGTPNTSDLDDDNDGVTDVVELATAPANGDTDGDGIKDSLDLDSDNDGINDVIEGGGTDANKDGLADGTVGTTPTTLGIPATAGTGVNPPDTDGDGQKNFQDLDSDNDARSDLIESGNPLLVDADNDGIVDGTDPDKDGIVGPADGFTNWGDGNDPTPINIDGDSTPNYVDLDSDNDGAFDIVEGSKKPTLDTNNDGKIDNPTDADKDGVADVIDNKPGVFGGIGAPDSDGDGVPDSIDIDDDNDGVLDTVEGLIDSDGDGVPNSLDLDADNDGINDVREASISTVNNDTNNDGMKDGTADSVTGLIGTATIPVNTDNDANVDMLDLDTDNDAISDLVESGNPVLIDADKDGVVDGNDLDGDGILTSADTKPTFGDLNDPLPINTDNADEPNYRDLDSNNNDAYDITEGGYAAVDANNDGRIDNPADTDNDGIANAVDNKPTSWGGLSPKSSVTLNIKVLLQGAMFGTSNVSGGGGSGYTTVMRDDLRVGNHIPLSDPYRIAPYNAEFLHVLNPTTQTTTAAVLANTDPNNAIVDWVFIELRNANNPSSVVATMAALVQRDGDVVKASDGVSPVLIDVLPDNYYVAIRHRNHLGAMTATVRALDITPIAIDFTSMTDAQVYNSTATYEGYEMVDVNGKKALWAGNCNMDTKVKYAGLDNDSNVTLTEILNSVGNTAGNYSYNNCLGYFRGDVNMDGKSKYSGLLNDINYILNNVFNYGLNTSKNYSYNLLVEQLP